MHPFNPCNAEIRSSKFRINVSKMLKSIVIYGNDGQQCPLLSHIPCPFKNVPRQNNEFNCRIYLIYYAFKIMDCSEFSLVFNPKNYREYLTR